jgi:hypothetical protein
MLHSQFKEVLVFKSHHDGSLSKERVAFRKFQMSTKAVQSVVLTGLHEEVDDYVEVEKSYKVKKIGKLNIIK